MTQDKIIITSGYNIEKHEITEYIGHISAEVVLGTGFLSSLGAGLSDIFGVRSGQYENKLGQARYEAAEELRHEALQLGANAIIGYDIDYVTFSADIMGVIANGTAVKLEPLKHMGREIASLPIVNYSFEMPFRVGGIDTSGGALRLSGAFYGDNAPCALDVDVVFKNPFGDECGRHSLLFSKIAIDGGTFTTEWASAGSAIGTGTEKALLYVKRYLAQDLKVIELRNCVYNESTESVQKINEHKQNRGIDAIAEPVKTVDEKLCSCGKQNALDTAICDYCSRPLERNVSAKGLSVAPRRTREGKAECPICGREQNDNRSICMSCGAKFLPPI